jgi:hypothetical protein
MKILRKHKSFLQALAAAAVLGCTPAMAAPEINIALHKALYNFRLVSAEPGAGINGVEGKMYYEQDATCDAWTTEHRFTTEYQYAERPPVTDASHYVSFETKDGQQFNFSSERQEDGQMTEQLRGSVEKAADGGAKAVYTRPDDIRYDLPQGYLLPTAHTIDVIRHAKAGEHFFSAILFDGTDAEGPVEVGTFIGKKAGPDEIKKIAGAGGKIDAALLKSVAWHVRMAVFPLKDADESAPSYEMEMTLHDNGVVSHAVVDYKTFVVEQNLAALEKLPSRKCN